MSKIPPNVKSHVNAIVTNYDNINSAFPKLNLAAEQINSIFDQLFVEQIEMSSEKEWSRSILKLLFGAHSSWLQSYILTSAGFSESGLMLIRRSIEFTCYLSKIMNDHSKNKIWIDRNLDENHKRKFSSKFSIPGKYFNDKYQHLKPLIVWYDFASDFGAHGNFATLVSKIKKDEVELAMAFQDDKERIPMSTGVNVRIGHIILEAIIKEVDSFIKDKETFRKNHENLKKIVTDARIEILDFDTNGKYSNAAVKAIYDDDMTVIDEMFEKIKNDYFKKKQYNQPVKPTP
jgi:hypothetical protein